MGKIRPAGYPLDTGWIPVREERCSTSSFRTLVASKSASGGVLARSSHAGGRQGAPGSLRGRFREPFCLQKRRFVDAFSGSRGIVFFLKLLDVILARFSFCAIGCRSARAQGAHAVRTVKNQWISSIYQFLPSRRRAPRQAANPSNHVRKHVRTSFKNLRFLLLFRLPGGLPEKYPPGKPPGGSPGRSRPPPREAEIDQLFVPRCLMEPPN